MWDTSNIRKIFKVYSYSSKILEQAPYSFEDDILYDCTIIIQLYEKI